MLAYCVDWFIRYLDNSEQIKNKMWRYFWRSSRNAIVIVCISGSNDRNSLLKYITQNSVGAGASFQCTLCGKTNGQKNNIMNHVESIHFPDSFTYQCHLCDKIVKTKSALNLHNARYHSKKHWNIILWLILLWAQY